MDRMQGCGISQMKVGMTEMNDAVSRCGSRPETRVARLRGRVWTRVAPCKRRKGSAGEDAAEEKEVM